MRTAHFLSESLLRFPPVVSERVALCESVSRRHRRRAAMVILP